MSMRVGALLVTFVFAVTSVTSQAGAAQIAGLASMAGQPDPDMQDASERLRIQLNETIQKTDRPRASIKDLDSDKTRLRQLRSELREERADALAEFDAISGDIERKDLPKAILARQIEARRKYLAEAEQFDKYLARMVAASTLGGVRTEIKVAQGHSDLLRTARRHQEFDPEIMPFGRGKTPRRAPRTRSSEYSSLSNATLGGGQLSAAMLLPFSALTPPTAADLQGTEEVVLSPEVQLLAARLEHDPTKIYEWVYDNIRYVPSYGSIQGSVGTLRTRSGNAIDTASLLLALLRASGIPSRYVFGTIDVPIEKVKNWVGGVTDANAALDILAQGNVAVQGITQGGKIFSARFEHAWVEAYVDFIPSRGVKNAVPDSWIPMDASFKQYTYSGGPDAIGPPPGNELIALNQLAASVVVDESTGRVSGITAQNSRAVYDEATAIADGYITGPPGEEQLRVRTIEVNMRLLPALPSGLPYKVIAASAGVSEVPHSARRAFQVSLFRSVADRNNENPALNFTRNLSQLAGRRLSISFSPTTPDDAAALASYLPAPGPGGRIRASDLPESIPGYLIQLDVVATLDGVEIARAGGFTLGQEIATRLSIQKLSGEWHRADNINVAGEFMAVSLDLQGVGGDPVEKFAEQSPENLLHQAGRAYWVNLDQHLWSLSTIDGAVGVRQPSFGVFSTLLKPVYRYGIPSSVRIAGVSVDVDASLTTMMAFDGDERRTIRAVEQHGLVASALEHEIPQSYLASVENPARGASTVSVFAAAAAANQSVFLVTEQNWTSVRPLLSHSSEIVGDIDRAVGRGLEVLIPQAPVQIDQWRGSGYIIQDPETGSGAYRISGGKNGQEMESDVMRGLGFLGFGVLAIAVIIPTVAADSGGCTDDDGARRQVEVDWKLMLTLALIMAMIAALLAGTGGLGGAAVATLGRNVIAKSLSAVMLAFAPLAAYAGGGRGGGCFTFYLGTVTASSSMVEHNAHVRDSIDSGKPSKLTYAGPNVDINGGAWYNKYPECNTAARAVKPLSHECDEYPFKSNWEGGELNYLNDKVALLLLNGRDNRTGGGVYRSFLRACSLINGSRFKMVPVNGLSRGEDKNGNRCYTATGP